MSLYTSTRINTSISSYPNTKSSCYNQSFFLWLGCVDSRNLYTPKSSRFPGRKASRNVLASRSFTPGSPWALGIVMTPRRKASRSNLALGITIYSYEVCMRFLLFDRRPSMPANIPSYQMYLATTFEVIGW
jgi:hypothetical protein